MQQEMVLLFSWGKLTKENEGLYLLSLSSQSGKDAKRLFSAGWNLLQLKGWIGIRVGTFTHNTVMQLDNTTLSKTHFSSSMLLL